MMLSQKKIEYLIDQQQSKNSAESDWRDFAEQLTISFELNQKYRHGLGRYSRFFSELANGRFFGTRCNSCKMVYTPPRTLCHKCQSITEWHELAGTGTLKTFSVLHFNADIGADVKLLEGPLLLAYVLLDGSNTLFPHLLKCNSEQVEIGLRVKIAYVSGPVLHPLHLVHFIPDIEEL